MQKNLSLIITSLMVATSVLGCSFLPRAHSTKNMADFDIEVGEIVSVNRGAVVAGGNLIVIPFVAGANISANPTLDRASLMIVKGVADGLQNQERYFFLMTDDVDLADVIMEGSIDTFDIKGMLGVGKQAHLAMTVYLTNRYTDENILVMRFDKSAPYTKDVFDQLTYDIGQDIALTLMTIKE